VLDGSTQVGTTTVNQQQSPSGFNDAGGTWQDLGGPYTINSGTLVVRLTNAASAAVVADAIRIERITPPTPAPEIHVLDGSTNIADNTGTVSFGTTPPGTPVSKTFTVTNTGTQTLTLTPPISVPAGFTLTSTFGTTTLAPGASTTFVVRLDAATNGTFSGTVSFGNDDADENPFNFTISGTVAAAPVVTIIDDGSAGFATSGTWFFYGGGGYQGDLNYAGSGSGSSQATWTFTGLAPGQYRVSATWLAAGTSASNAPYTVLDGSTQVGAVAVNQQQTPNGFSDAGGSWLDLGGPYTINSGTLVVRLTNAANAAVVADAIRIERVSGATSLGMAQASSSIANVPLASTASALPLMISSSQWLTSTRETTLAKTSPAALAPVPQLNARDLAIAQFVQRRYDRQHAQFANQGAQEVRCREFVLRAPSVFADYDWLDAL
jgi:hypothetical protein